MSGTSDHEILKAVVARVIVMSVGAGGGSSMSVMVMVMGMSLVSTGYGAAQVKRAVIR